MTVPTAADILRAPGRGLSMPDPRRFGAAAAAVAGAAALAGLLVLTVLMATGAVASPAFVQAGHSSLPRWMLGPLPHGVSLSRGTFSGFLVAMLGCWAIVLLAARRLPWKVALGGIVLLHAVALLAPPMLSTDVFNYIDYGRLAMVHGFNPYDHGPIAAPLDPAFPWTGPLWVHTPTVYGPLFTLLSYPTALLGVAGALWTFKALAALASIGIVLCVAAAARAWGRDPVRPALAVGANPLIVLYAVAGAHNDLLMGLGLALGILFVARGREATGAGSVLVGAAMKASGLVVAPFLVLGSRRRLRTALTTAAIVVAGAAATLALFGTRPFQITSILARHERIGEYYSIPGWIATRFGLALPGHHARGQLELVMVAAVAACLLVALFRRRAWVSAAAVAALAVLALSTSFYPWYLALFLPLAALSPNRVVRLTGPAVTALAILMRTGHWLFGWGALHHLHHLA